MTAIFCTRWRAGVWILSITPLVLSLVACSDSVDEVSKPTLDIEPPVTTATPVGGTFTQATEVILNCSDAFSSCDSKQTYYSVDQTENTPSNFKPYNPANPIQIETSSFIRFYSIDTAVPANIENIKSEEYVIDHGPAVHDSTLRFFIVNKQMKIVWYTATDQIDDNNNLRYQLFHSPLNNVSTYEEMKQNGIGHFNDNAWAKKQAGVDTLFAHVNILTEEIKTHYWNVLVLDSAGNSLAYTTAQFPANVTVEQVAIRSLFDANMITISQIDPSIGVLKAYIKIDTNPEQEYPLLDTLAELTLSGFPATQHDFFIRFEFVFNNDSANPVTLAEKTLSFDFSDGAPELSLAMSEFDTGFDDDNDTITNITEVAGKTNPRSRPWTWVSGSKLREEKGVYSTGNITPGARLASASWTHPVTGDFWMFGGVTIDAVVGDMYFNDLWQGSWDEINSLFVWTWHPGIAGADGTSVTNQAGVYGTLGSNVPIDPTIPNVPGGRYGSVTWIDKNNNLWLFGGYGYDKTTPVDPQRLGYLNDLWFWDSVSGTWTWVSGSDVVSASGEHGVKGVEAPLNVPGARWQAVSWFDSDGVFWLFGGYGFDGSGNEGPLNDLWSGTWDGSAFTWKWESGNVLFKEVGVYGKKGTPAANSVPGARSGAAAWVGDFGQLWLFGGWGYSQVSKEVYLNDLWRWDGTFWTWISGSSDGGQLGSYNTQGISTPENIPGGRQYPLYWTDNNGGFWLWGGDGLNQSSSIGGTLNDLWYWDGVNWVWESGTKNLTSTGIYGQQGVAATANQPGSRYSGATWVDSNNALWLFGGESVDESGLYGRHNDLWRFDQ